MGNRKLNAALHQVVLAQARVHPLARAYLDKKRAEGKSNKEAIRCLKRASGPGGSGGRCMSRGSRLFLLQIFEREIRHTVVTQRCSDRPGGIAGAPR